MILALAAHLGIGLGALACKKCGEKFCRHHALQLGIIGGLLFIEALASVLVIDHIFHV